jgi:hypothetical protein
MAQLRSTQSLRYLSDLYSNMKIHTHGLGLYNCNFRSSLFHHDVDPLTVFSPRPMRPVALARKLSFDLCNFCIDLALAFFSH